MCSIYTISTNPSLVGKYFAQDIRGELHRKSNNVRITEETMVITADEPNVIQYMHFGLVPTQSPTFKSEYSTFNATKEKLLTSRLWAPLFLGHMRCLILADGFTEPQKLNGKTQHYRFTVPGEELITFAGLYAWWYQSYTKEKFGSFAIITVPSNDQVGQVHQKQRMPAILDVKDRDKWLSMQLQPEQYLELLQTWPDGRMHREEYDPFNKKKLPPSNKLELPF